MTDDKEAPMPADPVVALLPVTQEDRDQAAEYNRMLSRVTRRDAEAIRAGEWDDTREVQFFARHRTPAPAGDGHLRTVSRAIHEHLCRRDIMQYLDNEEDCEGLARSVIAALASPTPDSSAVSGSAEGFREAADTIAGWLQAEQDRLDAESGDYLMDTADCINVIREKVAHLTEGQQS